jgi:uncharacterized DUF497 family protein
VANLFDLALRSKLPVRCRGCASKWDPNKEQANRGKHHVGFSEAFTVFSDPLSITIPDPDHINEARFLIVGLSSKRRLFVVVHTIRDERTRLISARVATKHERQKYEEDSF